MSPSESLFKSWVFRLLAVNIIVYILESFLPQIALGGLVPAAVASGKIWQIFTYMFLHDNSNSLHLLLNMYALFMFGLAVEEAWGSKKFLVYYLFCGTGAGIVIFLLGYLSGGAAMFTMTVGASGAVFGLLLAFGYLFPEAEILFFFIIPMKARMMVIIFGAMELFMLLSGGMGNVSHIGHLGGILFGLIFIFGIDRKSKAKRKLASVISAMEKKAEAVIIGAEAVRDPSHEMKKNILAKLESGGGTESLTDDEYQFIKYVDIVTDSGSVMSAKSIDISDEHISDKKFIEQVKKFVNLS